MLIISICVLQIDMSLPLDCWYVILPFCYPSIRLLSKWHRDNYHKHSHVIPSTHDVVLYALLQRHDILHHFDEYGISSTSRLRDAPYLYPGYISVYENICNYQPVSFYKPITRARIEKYILYARGVGDQRALDTYNKYLSLL